MGREVKRVPLNYDVPPGTSEARRPRKGPGWQLWQTVSDGPISPVFKTADELIEFMCQPALDGRNLPFDPGPYPQSPWAQGWRRDVAERFVKGSGYIPSGILLVGGGGARMLSTSEMVDSMNAPKVKP